MKQIIDMVPSSPDWQRMALYAGAAALILMLVQRIPIIGRLVRALISFALLGACIFLLLQQAPYEPTLARLIDRLGLARQEVSGNEVRIGMAPDGHFWARVMVNGVPRRMLIDSGATITALSERTAIAASVTADTGMVPVILQTANGPARARTGEVATLQLGSIEARALPVVISPALGGIDVLGMNFLSALASWRVEGRTLILVPQDRTGARASGRHPRETRP